MVSTRSSSGNQIINRSNGNGTLDEPIKRVPLFRVAADSESLVSPIDRRSSYYRQQAIERNIKHHGTAIPIIKPKSPGKKIPILTLPTILTILRVFLVPVLVICWYAGHTHAPVATAIVFIAAAITDWLDGYLARKMALTTAFGAFLDPVADKVMVSTTLVLLATEPPPPIPVAGMTVPVSIIIAREITMSALREWAASSGGDAHKAVKVSSLGKWKTALQMTAMSLLLVLRNDHLLGNAAWEVEWLHRATVFCWGLLGMSAMLAMWSLARYMENVWHFFVHAHHAD